MSNAFEVQNHKYLQLQNFLHEADRKTFDTVIKNVIRESYEFVKKSQHFARKHILKDPDETIPAAIKRYKLLNAADKVIRFAIYGGLVYKIYDYFLF